MTADKQKLLANWVCKHQNTASKQQKKEWEATDFPVLQARNPLPNSFVFNFTQFIDGTRENELFSHIDMNKSIRPIIQRMQRTAYPPLK